jgi:hypothetical protein
MPSKYMDRFLREANADAIRQAIDGLTEAFAWSESPHGEEMWRAISDELLDILYAKKKYDSERRS